MLSRDTGHRRAYGTNPYPGYDRIDQSPFLYTGETDSRLRPMERVVTVSLKTKRGEGERTTAYPLSTVAKRGVLNDQREETGLVVFHRSGASSALDSGVISRKPAWSR